MNYFGKFYDYNNDGETDLFEAVVGMEATQRAYKEINNDDDDSFDDIEDYDSNDLDDEEDLDDEDDFNDDIDDLGLDSDDE